MQSLRSFFGDLTEDQEKAVKLLDNFIKSKRYNCFILQGYAGTGKTFLITGLAKFLKSLNIAFYIMSPTGRGASVIVEKIGEQAKTIHKTIYNFDEIEISEPSSDEKQNIKMSKENYYYKFYYKLMYNEHVNAVFIIDESSMVSDAPMGDDIIQFGSGKLLYDLILFSKVNKPDSGNKIIFIGDPAQLPPINMNFAPALSPEYLTRKYNLRVTGTFLTQVVRQKENNPILKLAHEIRNALEKKQFNYLELTEDKNIKFIKINEILNYIDVDKIKTNKTFIITSENKQTIAYNYIIKSNLFNSEKLEPEDKLIIFKNNYAFGHELYNGQIVEVISIDKPEIYNNVRFRDIILKTFDYSKGNDVYVKCKIYENFVYKPEPEVQPSEWNLIFKIALVKNSLLKKTFEKYRSLKNVKYSPELVQVKLTLAKLIRDDPYINAVLAKFGYSSTCHKAQGGEWDEVFIDMKTYMSKTSKFFFNWFYTAVTRAKSKVFLINYVPITPLSKTVSVSEIQPLENKPTEDEMFYFPENVNIYDNISFKFDFQRKKYIKLNQKFKGTPIKVELVNQFDWRDRYKFTSLKDPSKIDYVVIDFIYNLRGYNEKYEVSKYSSEEFKDNVISMLKKPLIIEPPAPTEKWKFYLYETLNNICKKLNIKITNIAFKEYADVYYLLTEENISLIEFWYDNRNMYTKIIPKSEITNDEKLKTLLTDLQRIIDNVKDNGT